jgi:hypothetical protein
MQDPKKLPIDVMSSPEAAALLKNKDTVMGLLNSPDAKKLMELLNQNGGANLKGAADAAMKGDSSALMGLMQKVMDTKEGAAAMDRLQKTVPKK